MSVEMIGQSNSLCHQALAALCPVMRNGVLGSIPALQVNNTLRRSFLVADEC